METSTDLQSDMNELDLIENDVGDQDLSKHKIDKPTEVSLSRIVSKIHISILEKM